MRFCIFDYTGQRFHRILCGVHKHQIAAFHFTCGAAENLFGVVIAPIDGIVRPHNGGIPLLFGLRQRGLSKRTGRRRKQLHIDVEHAFYQAMRYPYLFGVTGGRKLFMVFVKIAVIAYLVPFFVYFFEHDVVFRHPHAAHEKRGSHAVAFENVQHFIQILGAPIHVHHQRYFGFALSFIDRHGIGCRAYRFIGDRKSQQSYHDGADREIGHHIPNKLEFFCQNTHLETNFGYSTYPYKYIPSCAKKSIKHVYQRKSPIERTFSII